MVYGMVGHGDELVLADANFPSESTRPGHVIRADGHSTTALMEGVLALLPLDTFVKAPAVVMQQVDKPKEDAPIVAEFQKILNKANGSPVTIERIDR
jgi:L-fucose mutarotase